MQCRRNIGGVDHLAPRTIDNHHALLHRGDRIGVDHVSGFIGEIRVQRNDIAASENLLHTFGLVDTVLDGKIVWPINIVGQHVQAERASTSRNFFADAP